MTGAAFFGGFCLGIVFTLALAAMMGGLFLGDDHDDPNPGADDVPPGRNCGHPRHFGNPRRAP